MKTLVVPIFQSFISRSILITNAFKNLLDKDIRIVLLVPDNKKDFYQENFGKDNVIVEAIDEIMLRKLSSGFFQKLSVSLLPTYFIKYRNKENRLLKGRLLSYLFNSFVIYLLGSSKLAHRFFRFLDSYFANTDLFDGLIDKHKPDLVFATDIYSPADVNLVMSANRHQVKCVGMVRSWDCPTNKNLLRVVPEEIIALNKNVVTELVKFHDVKPGIIEAVGFPQFDPYFSMKPTSRENFFKKIGVNIEKRLIMFAPAGSDLVDIDWQYCEILDNAQKEGKIPSDVCFLIRKHPQDRTDLSRIEGNPNFIIEQPGKSFGHQRSTELDVEATQHLVDSIYHSELLISVNTTLGLDVLVFDKPHIMLAFDGYEKRSFLKSVRRFQREDNMKDFIDTGAVKIVNTPNELFEWVNRYLVNGSINIEDRERARSKILYKNDGRAGDRIASIILRKIS